MDTLVHHLLRASASKQPEKEALVQGERRLTFRELDQETNRVAAVLRNAGLRRLDRVGVFLEKSVDEVLAMIGTWKAGGVFVPINHLLFAGQVEHIINDCGARAIVTSGRRLGALRNVLAKTKSVEVVLITDEYEGAPLDLPVVRWTRELSAASDEPLEDLCISNDMAAFLYTSGSTGRPKGVVVSHANLRAGSEIVSTYLGITERERILSVLPFSFDYGLNQLLTGLEHAATVILLTFHFPDQVVQAILRENVTGLAGVPSFWSVFVQPGSSVYSQPLPSLRYITNSGGAVPKALLDRLREALPTTDIVLMYGLTEAFRSTYLPPSELDRRPGSMGRAIPDTEIYVVNDEGELCGPGEPGELVHRGPTVSLGYWGQPEATQKVIRANPLLPPELGDAEKVCYSGDLVKMDEDGFLYFLGRRDATIKCSGYRISPTEIEDVLVSSGKVREAAAVGVPDAVMGQAVWVTVVPNDGDSVEPSELIDLCAGRMPRYMVPKRIEVARELPKTPHGKIDYPTLRASVLERNAQTT
jgi:acyl-CoA ligase (AMP-forming) (exosortase A-associated)